MFALYERPNAETLAIELAPRLESWMGREHPDQVRLREYLDWLEPRAAPRLLSEGNALELVVAVPMTRPLDSGSGDLDNYVFPIVRRLGHQRFLSVWAAKDHAERSSIAIGPATVAPLPDASWHSARAEMSEPKDTAAWKNDVDAQIRAQVPTPVAGRVEIQISYIVEPSWNWAVLWKPSIDALGAIVGDGPRPFHPLDDRIVRLALHRRVEARRPRRTSIGVWWRPAP